MVDIKSSENLVMDLSPPFGSLMITSKLRLQKLRPFPPALYVNQLLIIPRKHRYVALKVIVSKDSHKTSELSILQKITSLATTSSHPGRHHITILLDHFFHLGPNGRHLCLIFEIMGPSSASMVRELDCNQTPERKYESPKKYALPMVKRLLRHTLLGLGFLHENGIVHGDLNPGNLLFSVALRNAGEEELRQQVELGTSLLGTEKRGTSLGLKDVTNVMKVAMTLVTTTAAKEEENGKLKPKIKLKKLDGSGSRIANGFLRWFKSKRKPGSKARKTGENDKNDTPKADFPSTKNAVPQYLAVPQSLAKFVDPKNFTVKISDFGGGMSWFYFLLPKP